LRNGAALAGVRPEPFANTVLCRVFFSLLHFSSQKLGACGAAALSVRPLSKTVRFNVLRVIPAGSGGDKKGFSSF